MRKDIRVGDIITPITYDYMQEANPVIRSKPDFYGGKETNLGLLTIPETARALERVKVGHLVWWKIKTNDGLQGWVPQAEIIRANWFERRKKYNQK